MLLYVYMQRWIEKIFQKHKGEKKSGEAKDECGGIWGEEQENADHGIVVQPNQQHVAPCLNVVEWGFGTRGCLDTETKRPVQAGPSNHNELTHSNAVFHTRIVAILLFSKPAKWVNLSGLQWLPETSRFLYTEEKLESQGDKTVHLRTLPTVRVNT